VKVIVPKNGTWIEFLLFLKAWTTKFNQAHARKLINNKHKVIG
jgi:hypothetical protein